MSRLSLAVRGVLLGAAVGLPALAQVAYAAETDAKTQAATEVGPKVSAATTSGATLEEVTVTGSRLKRTTFSSSSPLEVITTEQTSMAGLLTTEQILQQSTLAAGSQQINNQTTGFVTAGGPGAETLSLRGLGPQRTLILINGRRLAPAGARGQVGSADLNTIPQSIVQRIEILKDGASSIYGSDAVAGVVNVITYDKLDGGQLNLNGTFNEGAAGNQRQASGSWGKNFENGHISIGGEYFRREPLRLGDRDFTACAQENVQNVTTASQSIFANSFGNNLDIIDPATGQSKCFNLLNGVIDRLAGAGGRFVPDPTAVAGGGALGLDIAGWRRVGASFAQVTAARPTLSLQDRLNLWYANNAIVPNNPANFGTRTFVAPVTRKSLFSEGAYEFNKAAEVYGEVLLNQRNSAQESYRQLFPNVAATNPSNPFGVISRSIVNIPTNQEQEVKFYRGVAGLRGEFPFLSKTWSYDGYFQYTKSKATYTNDIIYNDRVNATTGATACNPALITISGSQPNAGCTAINWFRPSTIVSGDFSQAEKDFLFTRETGSTEYKQRTFALSATGRPFDTWAGPVGVALGVEYRKDSIDDTPGFNARNGNLWGQTSAGRTAGDDTVKEAFGEIEIPLAKDLPLMKSFTVTVSDRYTDYRSYGSGNTYKFSANWAVTDQVRLRGSLGTSFRAPALYELFLANQTGFVGQGAIDPCTTWETSGNPSIVANCGPGGDNLPAGWQNLNSSALVITGGGRGILTAETSRAFTYGIVWTPDSLPVSTALDYWKIKVNNQVAQFGAANILGGCYGLPDRAANPFCTLFTRNLTAGSPEFGKIDNVKNSFVNISNQVAEGIDLTARFSKPLGPVKLRIDTTFTYALTQATQLFSTFPTVDTNGTIYANKWNGQIDVRIDWKAWTFGWSTQILSKVSNDRLFGGDTFGWRVFPNCATSTSTSCVSAKYIQTASQYDVHAVSLRYRNEHWLALVGVSNVFNTNPPLLSTGSGAIRLGNAIGISNYDVLGRRLFANLSYSF
jgi:iron complex outermembrane receptor protein